MQLSLLSRYAALAICLLVTAGTLPLLGQWLWLWPLPAIAGLLSLVGLYDLWQPDHSVRRNYPVAIATHFGAEASEEVNIVGCLCTPLDRLADDVMTPAAAPGDLVAVFLAGAYGLSASPQAFLTQQPAIELAVNGREEDAPPRKGRR